MLTKLFLVFAALSRVDAFLTSPSEDDLAGRSIRRRPGQASTTRDIAQITGKVDDDNNLSVWERARKRIAERVAQAAQWMCDSTQNARTCENVKKFKEDNFAELTTPFCTTVASGEYKNLVEEFGPNAPWCFKATDCDKAFTYSNRDIDIPGTGIKKTNVFRKCSFSRDGKCRVENMGAQDEAYSHKFVAHLCNMACVNEPDSANCVDEIPICCDDFDDCETCESFLSRMMSR